MQNLLREALVRLWSSVRSWWGRRGPVAAKNDVEAPAGRPTSARARFWAELREGQREAEVRAARLRS